jgi:S-adenosylmethionine/arginine decarboxylase-like enzyme
MRNQIILPMNHNAGPERLIAQMKELNSNSNGFLITSTLKSTKLNLLLEFRTFKLFINEITSAVGLKRTGEFYFNFAESGFTGIVCFQGSHLSLRTAPPTAEVTFDLFLSDRVLNNINLSEELYRKTATFFCSEVVRESYEAVTASRVRE